MTKKTEHLPPRVLFDPVTSEWVVAREYVVYVDESSARESVTEG